MAKSPRDFCDADEISRKQMQIFLFSNDLYHCSQLQLLQSYYQPPCETIIMDKE